MFWLFSQALLLRLSASICRGSIFCKFSEICNEKIVKDLWVWYHIYPTPPSKKTLFATAFTVFEQDP
jgi:hypothetical protein